MASVVDRDPGQIDWNLRRGDTWDLDFTLCVPTTASPVTGEPADLTGSTWRLHLRTGDPDGPLFAAASVDATAQSVGVVVGSLAATATTGATVGKRVYYYDLEQTLSGKVATPVAGWINVSADASRTD